MSSAVKRAFEDADDGSPNSKRPRTDDNGTSKPATSAADELARKKAEIQAKFAAMRQQNQAGPSTTKVTGPGAAAAAAKAKEDIQRRIAETARKLESKGGNVSHPFLALLQQRDAPDAKGGGIHPLLRQSDDKKADEPYKQTNKERYAPMAPKFATSRANQRAAPAAPSASKIASSSKSKGPELPRASLPTLDEARQNPYFDRRLGVESLAPKAHKARPLRFNARGKFERIAEEKRREAHMEEVKRRVLESARKAGMETEVDVASSAKVRRPAPPDIEWWDAAYLPSGSYDDVDNGVAQAIIYDYAKEGPDKAAITAFIQHPIPIPAPQDKHAVKIRPLDLTTKERKKKRKAERAIKLKDRQDRQRMGLLPPEPPKVKLGNMMRVLTKEAVMDPTKVEAQVRKEMFARKNAHEKSNEERKLTHEDKVNKLEAKKAADEALGIHAAVFRVLNLSNGQHKFKIRKNAEQLNLTGCTLFHPRFALVIVEGGQKGIKAFTKLMMRRIVWTDEAPSRGETAVDEDEDDGTKKSNVAEEMKPAVPMAENRCDLVWSGEHRSRIFEGMRPKSVPTDHMAREWLGPRAEGYWDLARKDAALSVAV